jgi:hypothetical protein
MKSLLFILLLFLINCQEDYGEDYEETDDGGKSPLIFNTLFKNLKEEWTKRMPDFVSQYIYLIPVPYKKKVILYENITRVPCRMRGAFLLEEAESENDKIAFRIIAPNETVIFESYSIGSIFTLNLVDPGLYTIFFKNKKNRKEVQPTLIMNAEQNLVVEKETLSKTEKKLDEILQAFQKFGQETKLNRGYVKKENIKLSDTNKYFYTFSIVETLVLIGVSLWQYYYLKHLFEIKGSL